MTALIRVDLTRFKCFASQSIELAGATVLTGLNGMGKSSLIQALLLRVRLPIRNAQTA